MMKKIIALAVAYTLILNLSAQSYEKKASEILQKVTEKTKSYTDIKVEFTYTLDNKEAKLKESKKGILLIKGDKYNLKLAGQTVISNGKTIWTYIPDAKEIQINTLEEDDESMTPTKLLTSYYKNYKSKLIKESTENGKEIQVIDCVPLEGKSYFKVRLSVDKKNLQITEIAIFDKNGSIYTYTINSFVTNTSIPDAKFTYNKADYPSDTEVVDMR